MRVTSALRKLWWRLSVPYRLRAAGVAVAPNAVFYGMPIVFADSDAEISIGARTVVCSNSLFTALGVAHPTVLRAMRPGAIITVGDDCGLSGASICAARRIEIGNGVLIGADVMIVDTDFHRLDALNRRYLEASEREVSDVVIEDNVFIGARSIILKGVHIGANSVIGAGSVVTKSVPSGHVAAGNPARIIRALDCAPCANGLDT